jgi:hypothetical protein
MFDNVRKGPNETIYDYTNDVYKTVFKPIVEDRDGQVNLLYCKKILAGFYAYVDNVGKHNPKHVVREIVNDYKITKIKSR